MNIVVVLILTLLIALFCSSSKHFDLFKKALSIKPKENERCIPIKSIRKLENLAKNLKRFFYQMIPLTALIGMQILLIYVIVQIIRAFFQ